MPGLYLQVDIDDCFAIVTGLDLRLGTIQIAPRSWRSSSTIRRHHTRQGLTWSWNLPPTEVRRNRRIDIKVACLTANGFHGGFRKPRTIWICSLFQPIFGGEPTELKTCDVEQINGLVVLSVVEYMVGIQSCTSDQESERIPRAAQAPAGNLPGMAQVFICRQSWLEFIKDVLNHF